MVHIDELKANKDVAWKQFYAECYPKVTAMLLTKGCAADRIDDFFHDGMAVFYNRVVFGNPEKPDELIHAPVAFVKRIVLNLFLKNIRDTKSTAELSDTLTADLVDQDDYLLDEETTLFYTRKAMLDQCWALLEEACQNILQLYYFKRLRDKETAARLGYALNSVKTKRSRCMRLLRACIKNI